MDTGLRRLRTEIKTIRADWVTEKWVRMGCRALITDGGCAGLQDALCRIEMSTEKLPFSLYRCSWFTEYVQPEGIPLRERFHGSKMTQAKENPSAGK
jgi:hypothetical protein